MDQGQALRGEDILFAANDGLALYARDIRPTAETTLCPVICLPGLSRNGRDFDGIARMIATAPEGARRVILPDSRGRGRSARDPDPTHYTVGQELADLVRLMEVLSLRRAVFIGTSRGGILLHLLASQAPDTIAACVLNDIGPVIETGGLLAIRDALKPGRTFIDFAAAAEALRIRYGRQFPALSEADWAEMARAIHTEQDGVVVPDFDPAIMAPFATLTADTVLPSAWPSYEALARKLVLVIRGALSDILSEETAIEMVRRGEGRARLVTVPGQGHVPLLHTEPAASAILSFLATNAID